MEEFQSYNSSLRKAEIQPIEEESRSQSQSFDFDSSNSSEDQPQLPVVVPQSAMVPNPRPLQQKTKANNGRLKSNLKVKTLPDQKPQMSPFSPFVPYEKTESESHFDSFSTLESQKERIEGVFFVHGKQFKSAKNSLYFFGPKSKFLLIINIAISSVSYATYNYSKDQQTKDYILFATDIFFVIEIVMNTLAYGLFMHEHSFLRSFWNFFDFLVALAMLINVLEKVKLVADPLIYSLSFLVNVTIFMIFMFILFGIIGLQFFQGVQYSHCRITENPVNATYWPMAVDSHDTCLKNSDCSEGLFCGHPQDFDISLKDELIDQRFIIQYGISTFDNFYQSLLTVFQVITTDNWSQLMFNTLGGTPNVFFALVYFCIMVISGAFFFINLILAVILQAFTEVHQKQLEETFKAKDEALKKQQQQEDIKVNHARAFHGNVDDVFQRSIFLRILHFFCPFKKKQFFGTKAEKTLESVDSERSQIFGRGKTLKNIGSEDQSVKSQKDKGQGKAFNFLVPSFKIENQSSITPLKRTTSIVKGNGLGFQSSLMKQNRLQVNQSRSTTMKTFMRQVTKRMNQLEAKEEPLSAALSKRGKNKAPEKKYLEVQKEQQEILDEESKTEDSFDESEEPSGRSFDMTMNTQMNLKISDSVLEEAFKSGLGTFKQKLLFIESKKRAARLLKEEKKQKYLKQRREESKLIMNLDKVVKSDTFLTVINLSVFLSVLSLAMEQNFTFDTIQCLEVFFFCLFFLEVLAKLAIQGIKIYFRDYFNLLDLSIVLLTSFDLIIFYFYYDNGMAFNYQALLASAKVLRVFKLIKLWDKMSQLVKIIFNILKDIGQFTILLSIFVQAFAFLGMKIFAFKLEDPDQEDHNVAISQTTFNTFHESLLAIFIVFANDGWSTILVNYYRMENKKMAVIYFLVLKLIGGYILLNLFLAILLENYNRESIKSDQEKEMMEASYKIVRFKAIKALIKRVKEFFTIKRKPKARSESIGFGDFSPVQKKTLNVPQACEKPVRRKSSSRVGGRRNTTMSSKTLGVFHKDSQIRVKCQKIVLSKQFQFFIIISIIASSFELALENPMEDQNSARFRVLFYIDIFFSLVFIIEAILKIIATGFYWAGPRSYLKNSWNKLDFLIVIFSFSSFFNLSSMDLSALKVLRLIRILRPLRMLSRSQNLKIAISSLLNSFPSMLDVIAVTVMNQIFLAGIAYKALQNRMKSCYGFEKQSYEALNGKGNKWDCINTGGQWKNQISHFDTFADSVISVGHMSTTAGWAEVMYQAVSEDGPDKFHKPMNNPAISLFFVFLIISSSFFLYNFFIGVVISSFNREKEKVSKDYMLMENQKQWLSIKLLILSQYPFKRISKPTYSDFRAKVYDIAVAPFFDNFMLFLIILNTISMSIRWYNWEYESTEDFVNNIFLIFYIIEAVMKLVAFGWKYFTTNWNRFDFIVVLAGLTTFMIKTYNPSLLIGPLETVFRAIKLFRLIKLIKQNKSLQVIFQTLIQTLPQLANAGLLLILFLYIYAILGITLFADVKTSYPLNKFIHFQSFFPALLLLFRVSTGENWQQVVYAYGKKKDLDFDCMETPSYQDYVDNGKEPVGCGNSTTSTLFFFSFLFIVTLIFLNLFIAIVLQQFQHATMQSKKCFTPDMAEHFKEVWSNYDQEASGLIPMRKFEKFMLSLGEPLGWNIEEALNKEFQVEFVTKKMEIVIYQSNNENCFSFYEVLESLALIVFINSDVQEQQLSKQNLIKRQKSMVSHHTSLRNQEVRMDDFEKIQEQLAMGEKNEESNTAKNVERLMTSKRISLSKSFGGLKVFKKSKAMAMIENSIKKSKLVKEHEEGVSDRDSVSGIGRGGSKPASRINSQISKRGKLTRQNSPVGSSQNHFELDKFNNRQKSLRNVFDNKRNINSSEKPSSSEKSSSVEDIKVKKKGIENYRESLNKQFTIGVASLDGDAAEINAIRRKSVKESFLNPSPSQNFDRSYNMPRFQGGGSVQVSQLSKITSESGSSSLYSNQSKELVGPDSSIDKKQVFFNRQLSKVEEEKKVPNFRPHVEEVDSYSEEENKEDNSGYQVRNKQSGTSQGYQIQVQSQHQSRRSSLENPQIRENLPLVPVFRYAVVEEEEKEQPFVRRLLQSNTDSERKTFITESAFGKSIFEDSQKGNEANQIQNQGRKETGNIVSAFGQIMSQPMRHASQQPQAAEIILNSIEAEEIKVQEVQEEQKAQRRITLNEERKAVSTQVQEEQKEVQEEEEQKIQVEQNEMQFQVAENEKNFQFPPRAPDFGQNDKLISPTKYKKKKKKKKGKKQTDFNPQMVSKEEEKKQKSWRARYNISFESQDSSQQTDNNERVFDHAKIIAFNKQVEERKARQRAAEEEVKEQS